MWNSIFTKDVFYEMSFDKMRRKVGTCQHKSIKKQYFICSVLFLEYPDTNGYYSFDIMMSTCFCSNLMIS